MDNTPFKLYTLYPYKDDLLGCIVLRHKYSHHSPIQLHIRDFDSEKIDITLNNIEFMVHSHDQERAMKILSQE